MFSRFKIFFALFIFTGLLAGVIVSFPDGKLHLTFCDVGQGDGTYIRTPDNLDMLIDGGPDDKILSCLGRHMPFYDRTIDMVVLTHPQKDHMKGILSVIDRYTIKHFVIGIEGSDSQEYQQLISKLNSKKIPLKNLFAGDKFRMGELQVGVFWPDKSWVFDHLSVEADRLKKDQIGSAGQAVLGLSTEDDLNQFSFYLKLGYRNFSALMTGDGDSTIQNQIMDVSGIQNVQVLKIPHHGSKTALSSGFLDRLKPALAVISVGKNSFGHPTNEILKQLSDRKIEVKRTDRDGDVNVVSDGLSWKIVY